MRSCYPTKRIKNISLRYFKFFKVQKKYLIIYRFLNFYTLHFSLTLPGNKTRPGVGIYNNCFKIITINLHPYKAAVKHMINFIQLFPFLVSLKLKDVQGEREVKGVITFPKNLKTKKKF